MSLKKHPELSEHGIDRNENHCRSTGKLSTADNFLTTADQFVQNGLAHHQAGELVLANDAYQEALKLDPNQPDALHLLGMIAHQIGDNTLATELRGNSMKRSHTFARRSLSNQIMLYFTTIWHFPCKNMTS